MVGDPSLLAAAVASRLVPEEGLAMVSQQDLAVEVHRRFPMGSPRQVGPKGLAVASSRLSPMWGPWLVNPRDLLRHRQ